MIYHRAETVATIDSTALLARVVQGVGIRAGWKEPSSPLLQVNQISKFSPESGISWMVFELVTDTKYILPHLKMSRVFNSDLVHIISVSQITTCMQSRIAEDINYSMQKL